METLHTVVCMDMTFTLCKGSTCVLFELLSIVCVATSPSVDGKPLYSLSEPELLQTSCLCRTVAIFFACILFLGVCPCVRLMLFSFGDVLDKFLYI